MREGPIEFPIPDGLNTRGLPGGRASGISCPAKMVLP